MEPNIIINGTQLTSAQAMTIRVALGSFRTDMMFGDGLGGDCHGRRMTDLYLERTSEIETLLIKKQGE